MEFLSLMISVTQAERSHPGLTESFLGGLLEAEGVSVNLPEALLQLACWDGDQYTINSEEDEYVHLNERAKGDNRFFFFSLSLSLSVLSFLL